MKIRLFILLSFASLSVFGQNNTITNGKKTKTLSPSKFYEIQLGKNEGSTPDCCDFEMIFGGNLIFEKDSFTISLVNYQSYSFQKNVKSINFWTHTDLYCSTTVLLGACSTLP